MSSDTFIGILCKEYKIRTNQANNGNNNGMNGSVNLGKTQSATGTRIMALIASTANAQDTGQVNVASMQKINVRTVGSSDLMQRTVGQRKRTRIRRKRRRKRKMGGRKDVMSLMR